MNRPEGELAERIAAAVQRWSEWFGVGFDTKAGTGLAQEIYAFYLEGVVEAQKPDPMMNFDWDPREGSYACGFCCSHDTRIGGIKSHIRENHIKGEA